MKRIAVALVLSTLAVTFGVAAQPEDKRLSKARVAIAAKVVDLQPFSHVARLPLDSDSSTIRFEKVKLVRIPTTITYTMNRQNCEEAVSRDTGGSASCLELETGSPAMAYEVTYSYVGQPLTSDEFGQRNFRFEVYFRPEELPSDTRQAVASKRRERGDLAAYFNVSVQRESVPRAVIDQARSRFCDGNFVDGAWVRSDRDCRDEVVTKVAASAPDYLTVRVDSVPPAKVAKVGALVANK